MNETENKPAAEFDNQRARVLDTAGVRVIRFGEEIPAGMRVACRADRYLSCRHEIFEEAVTGVCLDAKTNGFNAVIEAKSTCTRNGIRFEAVPVLLVEDCPDKTSALKAAECDAELSKRHYCKAKRHFTRNLGWLRDAVLWAIAICLIVIFSDFRLHVSLVPQGTM